MDKARYVERILEVENLTDELEDAQANWLLEWGIAQLDWLLEDVSDEEIAGARVNALMAAMRKVNRATGSRAGREPAELAADFATLADLWGRVRGCEPGVTPADCEQAAAEFIQLPAEEAVKWLVEWCEATVNC